MREPIKIGILGMGGMGRAHAMELQKIPEARLVALCDSTLEAAKQFNQETGANCLVFDDFDEMIERAAMDALYVCLPPFAHDGQIEKAAARGLHVFAEKPLALTLEAAERMDRAVTGAGVKSMMGYHMRFGGAIEQLKRLIDSGEAGRTTLFVASYECNNLHSEWWRDANKSGGQIFEQIIHLYDMAYYLMGEADSASGYIANLCHRDVPGYTVEDTSAVSLRFKSGALASITGSNCAVPWRWDGLFKLVCENMVVECPDFNRMKITHTKGEVREEELCFDTDARAAIDRRFIDVLLGNAPQFATIAEGLQGVRMVAAAVTSAKQNGTNVQV